MSRNEALVKKLHRLLAQRVVEDLGTKISEQNKGKVTIEDVQVLNKLAKNVGTTAITLAQAAQSLERSQLQRLIELLETWD